LEALNYIQSPIYNSIIELELDRSYPYFQNLTNALKQRFVERTATFIKAKKFVGRQDLKITDQIRILVSACAVQVTFGLDHFTIDHFEYVVIYPDVYESPVTGKMHKGETNLNGIICLSWKYILLGIENPDDNYNLGLHEWTHALRFNSIKFDETDYFFDGYINKWVANAYREYHLLKSGKKNLFRQYGAANIHEFLSVSIEHFFESPDQFKLSAPELFDQTCILLNQVPSKKESARINVRNELLNVNAVISKESKPEIFLEASFIMTLLNFGTRLFYFALTLFVLLYQRNYTATSMALVLCMIGVVIMNNEYFTIKFYDDRIFLQSGFLSSAARKLSVNYHSLIKFEIYDGTFKSNMGTVFELSYYNGSRFITRTAYCSAIDVPKDKIKVFLQEKNVGVTFPY
jgi:Mlc titration factor MtfA (ptsG expression regulator)